MHVKLLFLSMILPILGLSQITPSIKKYQKVNSLVDINLSEMIEGKSYNITTPEFTTKALFLKQKPDKSYLFYYFNRQTGKNVTISYFEDELKNVKEYRKITKPIYYEIKYHHIDSLQKGSQYIIQYHNLKTEKHKFFKYVNDKLLFNVSGKILTISKDSIKHIAEEYFPKNFSSPALHSLNLSGFNSEVGKTVIENKMLLITHAYYAVNNYLSFGGGVIIRNDYQYKPYPFLTAKVGISISDYFRIGGILFTSEFDDSDYFTLFSPHISYKKDHFEANFYLFDYFPVLNFKIPINSSFYFDVGFIYYLPNFSAAYKIGKSEFTLGYFFSPDGDIGINIPIGSFRYKF